MVVFEGWEPDEEYYLEHDEKRCKKQPCKMCFDAEMQSQADQANEARECGN